MFAEVVVDTRGNPLNTTFSYAIPKELENSLKPGCLVQVPFGKQSYQGWIIGLSQDSTKATRSIASLLYPDPILTDSQIDLAYWLSAYYHEPLALCVKTSSLFKKSIRINNKSTGDLVKTDPHSTNLNEEQTTAVSAIVQSFGTYREWLLHGVTGSGKTEVYLALIQKLLKEKPFAQILVLVPEIALTPQMVARFSNAFPGQIIVWHSQLSDGQRYRAWLAMRNLPMAIVIGSRSAVFSPLRKLSLIIIDECHEWSYKQGEKPRYHARTVAAYLASKLRIPLVLGSATPSVETYFRLSPKSLLSLPKRIGTAQLPKVTLVDMREELKSGNYSIFSQRLTEHLSAVLSRREQAVLFLNRRGFAKSALCRACGFAFKCSNCDVHCAIHKSTAGSWSLLCHHCAAHYSIPPNCPKCHSPYFRPFGAGTQRVEAAVRKLFPSARLLRMDRDSTSRRGTHTLGYHSFKEGSADILIGTQMIAKGWDIPNVTLVGILAADLSLTIPDYTAAERTFELITQVAGRAGRGSKVGTVILQTYNPKNPTILAASLHDYYSFYTKELSERREYNYPPFCSLTQIGYSHSREKRAWDKANALAKLLAQQISKLELSDVSILGPAPAMIAKRRGMYTVQLALKTHAAKTRNQLISLIPSDYTVDVDPIGLA